MLIDLSVANVDTFDEAFARYQRLLDYIIEQSIAAKFNLLGVLCLRTGAGRELNVELKAAVKCTLSATRVKRK